MGKVSPNEIQSKTARHKRRSRNAKSKFLKPGALAQLRYSKASTSKSCMDLGKKRVAVSIAKQNGAGHSTVIQNKGTGQSPTILSPVKFLQFAPLTGTPNTFNPFNVQNTPKTPRADEWESESRLESLPFDLLVKILCHLHHDQLRAVFHVSQKIRKAVIIARQFHFNFTTPDRTRQEMLNSMTPLPTDHWPFMNKGGGKGVGIASPHCGTPKI